MLITNNEVERKLIYDHLITGTLYLVYNFIKSSGLLYLNLVEYDIDDLISCSSIALIEQINQGKLLKIATYSKIFNSTFYKKINALVNHDGCKVLTNISDDLCHFIKWYFDKKLIGNDISFNKFLDLYNNKYVDADKIYINIYNNSFNEYRFSLMQLKCFLIQCGIKNDEIKISSVKVQGYEDAILDNMIKKQLKEFIFTSRRLTNKRKLVLYYYFYNNDSLENIAKKMGVSKQCVDEIYHGAIFVLRNYPITKKVLIIKVC